MLPIGWDEAACRDLDGLGELPASYFQKLHDRGEVNTFAVLEDGERVGTLQIRWLTFDDTGERTAEVVALAGKGTSTMTPEIIAQVESKAACVGVSSLMFYTRRPGLVRHLARRAGDCEVMVGWRLK